MYSAILQGLPLGAITENNFEIHKWCKTWKSSELWEDNCMTVLRTAWIPNAQPRGFKVCYWIWCIVKEFQSLKKVTIDKDNSSSLPPKGEKVSHPFGLLLVHWSVRTKRLKWGGWIGFSHSHSHAAWKNATQPTMSMLTVDIHPYWSHLPALDLHPSMLRWFLSDATFRG